MSEATAQEQAAEEAAPDNAPDAAEDAAKEAAPKTLAEALQLLHGLVDTEGVVEAPTDVAISATKALGLPGLTWRNYGKPPAKLVVTNTGHTVNVGGKWESNRSYLHDGPFKGQYVFAQMHFHWGPNNETGSEHSVDGVKLPMELHVVHVNRIYRTQELALKENDGVAILIYLFQLQEEDNSDLTPIVEALPMVTLPQTSTTIEPMAMEKMIVPFQRDYFLYWGAVSSPTCRHRILWLTCRTPLGISAAQLAQFRQLRDVSGQYMVKNFRETHPRKSFTLFHVNPSDQLESTLLPPFPGHALAGTKFPSAARGAQDGEGSHRASGEASTASRRASGEEGERPSTDKAQSGAESGEGAERAGGRGGGRSPRRPGSGGGSAGGLQDDSTKGGFEDGLADEGYTSLEGTVLQESSQHHQDVLSLERVESAELADDARAGGPLATEEAEGTTDADRGASLECKGSHAESICMEDKEEQDRRKFSLDVPALDRVSEGPSAKERGSAAAGRPSGSNVQVDGLQGGAPTASVGVLADGLVAGASASGSPATAGAAGVTEPAGAGGTPRTAVPGETASGTSVARRSIVGGKMSSGAIPGVTASGTSVARGSTVVGKTTSGTALGVTASGTSVARESLVAGKTASGAVPKVTASGTEVVRTPSGVTYGARPSGTSLPPAVDIAGGTPGAATYGATPSGVAVTPGTAVAAATPSDSPVAGTSPSEAAPGATSSGTALARTPSGPTSSAVVGGGTASGGGGPAAAAAGEVASPKAIGEEVPPGGTAATGNAELDEGGKVLADQGADASGAAVDGADGQGGEHNAEGGQGGGRGGDEGGEYGGSGQDEQGGGSGGEQGGERGMGGGQGGDEDDDEGGGRGGWADATGEPEPEEGKTEEQELADGGVPSGGSASRASQKGSADGGQCLSEKGSKSSKRSKTSSSPGEAAAAPGDGEEGVEAVEQELGVSALTGDDAGGLGAAGPSAVGAEATEAGMVAGAGGVGAADTSAFGAEATEAGIVAGAAAGAAGVGQSVGDPAGGNAAGAGGAVAGGGAPGGAPGAAGGPGGAEAGPGAGGAPGVEGGAPAERDSGGAGAAGGPFGQGPDGAPSQGVRCQLPKFKYFDPSLEERKKRGPEPVFFNGIAVTPAVLHSQKSLQEMKVLDMTAVPCHGEARRVYEEERRLWLEREAAVQQAEREACQFARLSQRGWDSIALEMAQERKLMRPPDAEIQGTGWPFDACESEAPLLSPIDVSLQAAPEVALPPLVFDGHFECAALTRIANTGETVEVRMLNPEMTPTLHGGPLRDDYIFDSMHFHWGEAGLGLGSAHKVGGRRFCMEAHLLHYAARFGSKAEALRHEGGLCAVAFLMHLSDVEGASLACLASELAEIEEPMACKPLHFNALLFCGEAAQPHGYVAYPGSLIGREGLGSPNVVWIVYPNPVGICCQNAMQFQRLRAAAELQPSGLLATHDVAGRPVLRAVPP